MKRPDDLDLNLEDIDDIGVLLAEPGNDSDALARWQEPLAQYVRNQGQLDALRLRPSTEAPWPQLDNPMVGYLIERAEELAETDGAGAAIYWLATHSWFEATIAERSRLSRLLFDDV
jgi:hypothetical protein